MESFPNHELYLKLCYIGEMRERGAALPTVLALVTLVLIVGLAMGSMSVLSLQFNSRQVEGMRMEMAARGAVAQVLAKLHAEDREAGMDPLTPEPYRVVDRIGDNLSFEQDGYRATVTFTASENYSSDNLGGDSPMVGSPDSDDVPRIPPFSLDLVVNVDGPANDSQYRVGLRRVWPYALYTKLGPIVVMGDPSVGQDSNQASSVKGDVYTSWNGGAPAGGVNYTGYGFDPFLCPFNVLAYIEARTGLHPTEPPQWPLIIGQIVGRNNVTAPNDVHANSDDDTHFFFYAAAAGMPEIPSGNPADPTFGAGGATFTNGGNMVDGDFIYSYEDEQEVDLKPMVVPTPLDGSAMPGSPPSVPNEFVGDISQRRPLAVDPLAGTPGATVFSSGSFQTPPGLTGADSLLVDTYGLTDASSILEDRRDGNVPFLLRDDLELSNTHYVVNGSLTNRQVLYYKAYDAQGKGLYVRENRAGMKLQNTTLHVKGDLDLGAGSFDGPDPEDRVTVEGSAATLIVDGKLILGNATINAQDQGFMIYADDIVIKGGGNFFGLMIAKNSISILSTEGNQLNISGALLCQGRGGITLRGTQLKHDPEYLKSLNRAGDFQITSWKKL